MTTRKYDLHTIEYSVQGWDAVMNTDMEKLDDVVPSRVIGILNESVDAFDAVCLTNNGRWRKARADGDREPCLGIALEGGAADDEIRIHRLGELSNSNWSWSPGSAIYLSETSYGGLTQIRPSNRIQIVGHALSTTTALFFPETESTAVGFGSQIIVRGGTVLSPTSPTNVMVSRMPYPCRVTNVRGYRSGGTGASINARKNGSAKHLATDLSLINDQQWMDGGAVQNTDYSVGDYMEIMIVSLSGNVDQIAVQVDLKLI